MLQKSVLNFPLYVYINFQEDRQRKPNVVILFRHDYSSICARGLDDENCMCSFKFVRLSYNLIQSHQVIGGTQDN